LRELVQEVRQDIKELDAKFDRQAEKTQEALSRRPTRAEVLSVVAVVTSAAAFLLA
jgi:hypothetical protein